MSEKLEKELNLPSLKSCSTCQFWFCSQCRRYPPREEEGAVRTIYVFPNTDEDLWCGEWKAKDE